MLNNYHLSSRNNMTLYEDRRVVELSLSLQRDKYLTPLNLPKRKNIQKDKLNYQFGSFVTLKPRVGDVDNVGVGCCASPLLLNF